MTGLKLFDLYLRLKVDLGAVFLLALFKIVPHLLVVDLVDGLCRDRLLPSGLTSFRLICNVWQKINVIVNIFRFFSNILLLSMIKSFHGLVLLFSLTIESYMQCTWRC